MKSDLLAALYRSMIPTTRWVLVLWLGIMMAEAGENPMDALHRGARDGNWHFVEGMCKGLVAPEGSSNGYSPLAEWYYGIALHKLKRNKEAAMFLAQAQQNAKEASTQKEISCWQAEVALSTNQWYQARKHLNVFIADPAKPDTWPRALRGRLAKKCPIDTLMRWQEQGDAWARHIALKRFKVGEGTPAQRLWAKDQPDFKADTLIRVGAKDAKRIVDALVLLPLGARRIDVRQTPRTNQAWLDVYQGIKLAADDVADSALALNLHFYDLKNGFDWVDYLATMGELDDADLIIGPIVAQGSDKAAALAKRLGIPMLNPITNKVYWPADNQWVWLTETPASAAGKKLANWALTHLPCQKVSIVYGPAEQDSLVAKAYRETMKAAGKQVVMFHKVGKNSAANLPKFLLNAKMDSTGHIFAPNDEEVVKVQLPSTLSYIKLKVPVLTYGDWLNSASLNQEWAERWNCYFAEPHLYPQSESLTTFQDRFAAWSKVWPSTLTYQAYESVWVMAQLMKQGAEQWSSALPALKQPLHAPLGGQYDFSEAAYNGTIPIYRLTGTKAERVE